ncbi:hypothetical protein NY08_3870 [Rhodococcus sp. B7740]|nr:hypothetical protein NY08_3870 [Rhodococcus sp. B7740]
MLDTTVLDTTVPNEVRVPATRPAEGCRVEPVSAEVARPAREWGGRRVG